MSLTGNLRTMSLPDILQWISTGRKTGTLHLERRSVRKRIAFRDGQHLLLVVQRPPRVPGAVPHPRPPRLRGAALQGPCGPGEGRAPHRLDPGRRGAARTRRTCATASRRRRRRRSTTSSCGPRASSSSRTTSCPRTSSSTWRWPSPGSSSRGSGGSTNGTASGRSSPRMRTTFKVGGSSRTAVENLAERQAMGLAARGQEPGRDEPRDAALGVRDGLPPLRPRGPRGAGRRQDGGRAQGRRRSPRRDEGSPRRGRDRSSRTSATTRRDRPTRTCSPWTGSTRTPRWA